MSLLTDREPPREGTRLALTYWAARTRESLRFAEIMLAEGDTDTALNWAECASGCAGEYEQAMVAFVERSTA